MMQEDKPKVRDLPSGDYTDDPANSSLDRVRIMIGDADNSAIMIPQDILQWFLVEAEYDEKRCAIRALSFMLTQLAKMGDEKTGGIYLKNSERIKNIRLILDDLKAGIGHGIGSAYAGGISQSDPFIIRGFKNNGY